MARSASCDLGIWHPSYTLNLGTLNCKTVTSISSAKLALRSTCNKMKASTPSHQQGLGSELTLLTPRLAVAFHCVFRVWHHLLCAALVEGKPRDISRYCQYTGYPTLIK